MIVAWQRRNAPGGMPLMVLGAGIAIWSFTYALHFVSTTEETRYFWLMSTYVGVLSVPTAFLAIAIQYAYRGNRLKKRTIALLTIEPVLTFIILVTDPVNHLFFGGQRPEGLILSGGPWFWVNVFYSYALILTAIVLLAVAYQHSSRPMRGQAMVLLIGAFFPSLIDIAELLGVIHLGLDLTPVAFMLTSIFFTIGFARYRLLDLVPIARDALIESMDDGVIVLDAQNRIVDINPTALRMIGKVELPVIGESIDDAMSNISGIVQQFHDIQATHQELVVDGKPTRYLDLRISPLHERKGFYSGRLIVARDITERKMADQAEHEQRIMAEALGDTIAAMNSTHSFSELLDHLMDNVGRVVPYDLAIFMLLDEDRIAHIACLRDYTDRHLEEKSLHLSVAEIPNFRRMMETGQSLVVSDTHGSKNWIILEGLEWLRSYVGAPVKVNGKVVGFLDLASQTTNHFNQEHADRLQVFADQAAVAIENARLFEEIQQRAEQMTALFDIGLTVTSGLDMEQVLQTLLEKCKQVLPIEAFYIAIFDPETGLIHHPLFYDLGEFHHFPPRDIHKDPGLSGHIILTRQVLCVPDTTAPEVAEKFQVIRAGGRSTRSYVGVPLISGDRVAGVISMQSYLPNAYSPDQVRLLETIATQAASLIENSRLYNKAQQEIDQRKKAEQRYRALFEQSHDAVFILSFDGRILDVNQRAVDLLGYSKDELLQVYSRDVTTQPLESDKVRARLINGENIPLYEQIFRKKNGEEIDVEITAELVRDAEGAPLHIQSVARDIKERKKNEAILQDANKQLRLQLGEIEKLEAKLREQAIRDPLTNLFNRRYLEETLEREFPRAKREGTEICLIMVDIDGFKAFNDTYGHDTGDALLRRLGLLMRSTVRLSDISCRFGGEEFVMVMPGTSLDKGYERAERIRLAFEGLDIRHPGGYLSATLSLGVAVYPHHGETWQEVLHAADRAMYVAKDAGKNCTRIAKK
jgi:diguanylate cyclase (GGDEF)-like protein/PAS domain S-box-containing protein